MYQDEMDKFATLLDLLQQLVDQNEYNRKMCMSLSTLAVQVKTQAAETASVTPLHRVNVDLPKEVFESELERANAQAVIESHGLLYENRRLSELLKEYESTMDTIMSKFRNHALAAAQHELTLTRHYERLIYARETSSMHTDVSNNTNIAVSVHRLGQLLRALTRSMAGEDPSEDPPSHSHPQNQQNRYVSTYPPRPYAEFEHAPSPSSSYISSLDASDAPPSIENTITLLDDLLSDQEDWAHERETEIERLERENEELRRALGIDSATAERNGWLEDEARDLLVSRYVPIHPHRSSSPGSSNGSMMGGMRGMERSGSPVLGVGMFSGMRPPPPSPFMNVPSSSSTSPPPSEQQQQASGLMGGGGGNGTGLQNALQNQISVHLSQNANSALALGVVASQARDMTGGNGGMRGVPGGRRPAMFGRGRGGAGGAGTQLAREVVGGVPGYPGAGEGGPTAGLERPWQAQVGLDLS